MRKKEVIFNFTLTLRRRELQQNLFICHYHLSCCLVKLSHFLFLILEKCILIKNLGKREKKK